MCTVYIVNNISEKETRPFFVGFAFVTSRCSPTGPEEKNDVQRVYINFNILFSIPLFVICDRRTIITRLI